MADSTRCPDYRQAVTIARHSRSELREQEKAHEKTQTSTERVEDAESVFSARYGGDTGDGIRQADNELIDLDMDMGERRQDNKSKECGGNNKSIHENSTT